MSLKRLIQQNHNVHCMGYSVRSTYTPCFESIDSPTLDNRGIQISTNSVGTLPRDYKQLALCRTSSLGGSCGPQRKSLKIFKEDNETFGFEIQTLRFQQQSNCCLESCTYICKVKEGSPAHLSGLQSGYILTNINRVSSEGLSHKQMVDLIRSSGNLLSLDVVNEAFIMKRMELETKMSFLKQTLQEKLVEFQSLCLREQHLLHDEVDGSSLLDPLGLEESNLLSDYIGSGSALANKPRFSSESSCISRLSSMTVGSEDSFYQGGVFEDIVSEAFSQQSSTEDDCFLPRDSAIAVVKTSLRRHRSISVASSGSGSPLCDKGNALNLFGTLPRKSRKGSVRKRLLKFIPGLHRAVEEEESRV
ncbi:cytohesin-interacting protein [Eublepharis macularius]|uniref:Cytohesin-interacting protein n=1 Tax=Eublepharis macularius TaxID=481883 RepID=A0AA97IYG1_EUBMA|nr:cytohesin-interacting protein [Eublepharis macularius]